MNNSLGIKLWEAYQNLTFNNATASSAGDEFKNYFLGLISYKYLSEKIEYFLNKELKPNNLTFKEAYLNSAYVSILRQKSLKHLGFFVEPQYLYKSIVKKSLSGDYILEDLERALKRIGDSSIGTESEDDFGNLFEDVNLNSSKIGKNDIERNELISQILADIKGLDFKVEDENINILGEAYEYLINQIASFGAKKGEFYTPSEVSKLLAKLITINKPHLNSVYDPTCGSASLLLKVQEESKVSNYYGQEINRDTYNLARMNLILHGLNYLDFNIELGDTLLNPLHKDMKFDGIVSNPPLSIKWSADSSLLEDPRFEPFGKLAPKSNADYAFIQHMIYHLRNNGAMAVVLPHGVLFRAGNEKSIRKQLIDNNYLDAVIGLPANLFYSTAIPCVILVFRKNRNNNDILFIDASKDYQKAKNQNKLRDEDIDKIINAYRNRNNIDQYSYKANLDEIKENDYNLNIPRYVDTFVYEDSKSINEIYNELREVSKKLDSINEEIDKSCKDLGFKSPIFKEI